MQEFHVHIDAKKIDWKFDNFLRTDLGFVKDDFLQGDSDSSGYEPVIHRTAKFSRKDHFHDACRAIFYRLHRQWDLMEGYVECELVMHRLCLPHREMPEKDNKKDYPPIPFRPEVILPVAITTKPLPAGTFRETEIHVTILEDKLDPRLKKAFQDAGFYTAHIQRGKWKTIIFTMQGDIRKIDPIREATWQYLQNVGGFRWAKAKEERIVDWWTSSPDYPLPPVIA